MTYREKMELYKTGQLSEEEKSQVESDIERQDVISEFLFDRDFDREPAGQEDGKMEEDSDPQEENFMKYIRTAVRKTFIKAGVVIGAVVLAIVCFIMFAFPKIEDARYYNPAETVGTTGDAGETNRMSLDMAVYSELFLGGTYRDQVSAIANGNADYDICVYQRTSYSDSFTNVGGKIHKGKMILYDSNWLNAFSINNFTPSEEILQYPFCGIGAAGDKEEAYGALDTLEKDTHYAAYVTLDRVMSYSEFINFLEKKDLSCAWAALCFTREGDEAKDGTKYYADDLIGCIPGGNCHSLGFEKEKYPMLTQFSLSENMDIDKDLWPGEADMKKHVSSLMHYMADQDRFREMMGNSNSSDYFQKLGRNIEENGIHIYGFVMIGEKEQICALRDVEEVDYICTNKVKYQ